MMNILEYQSILKINYQHVAYSSNVVILTNSMTGICRATHARQCTEWSEEAENEKLLIAGARKQSKS